jgi:type IV fimbrial biogenesis protein FimT
MFAIRLRAARGFSLIEAMVALVALSLVLAIGMPAMSNWIATAKGQGAIEFYVDGLRTARGLAVKHNAASRLVFTENSDSGQFDWRVDICYPTIDVPCTRASNNWSTPTAAAAREPQGATGYRSLVRSASQLPKSTIMTVDLSPAGADAIYYNSVGWVNTAVTGRVTGMNIGSVVNSGWIFPSYNVVIGLAGMPSKCMPLAPLGDSRRCPP